MRQFTMRAVLLAMVMAGGMTLVSGRAAAGDACAGLPSHAELQAALARATATEVSGLNNQMWGTIVNRDGVVCAVAFCGANRAAQWPGSRVISAQKANTANAFSLDSSSSSNGSGQPAGLALSTANLYSAVQPGGSLYGIQHSNPVDTAVAYGGNPRQVRHQEQSDGRQPNRRRERLRRRPGALWPGRTSSWAASASAVTRRAPTTTSPGACATC